MYIDIPKDVKNIIDIFRENGYEAYAVGGCVRDALLKRIPKDWDITTSAKPEDIKRLFSKTIDTGIAHGTVTVRMSGESYEVTTYRIDGKYEDNRHPDSVTFTASLKEDLKRRDFTINAMAYAPDEEIIDIYGGVKDLNDGIIRCVGNPKERFDEDALRTLRAVRFAGQLGFNIEPETLEAVKEAAVRINNVSSERIRVEISKLIASEFPDRLLLAYETGLTAQFLPEWDDMMKTPQNNPNHIYNVGIHSIKVVEGVNRIYSGNDEREKRILTWSALLHDIANMILRFPRFAGIVVQIDHVLYRLVAVCILSHIHYLHFAHFVNDTAALDAEVAGHDENGVHHVVELFASAHQVDQSLRIVEHAETPMPAVSFAEVAAPIRCFEAGVECAFVVAAYHQFVFRVVHVPVVHGALSVYGDLLFGFTQFFTQRIDRPVVVGIFQCTCYVLSYTDVVGNISQTVVVFESQTTRSRSAQIVVRTVFQGVPKNFDVVSAQSFDVCVRYDGCRVVAYHAVAVSGARPFGQESTLLVSVYQTFLHLFVDRRVH